jgi:hypothetical protein
MSLRKAIIDVLEDEKKLDKEFSKLSNKAQTHANAEMRKGASGKDAIARAKKHYNEETIQEGEDVFDKFGIQITKTRLKGGIGYQINYGERGRYIQVLSKDMNNLMKAMQTAMKAK